MEQCMDFRQKNVRQNLPDGAEKRIFSEEDLDEF